MTSLRSHCIRQANSSKPDCVSALQRKWPEGSPMGVQQDTLSSPVSERESRNCGVFERFYAEYKLVSLQPRLNGGGRRIRTLGTALPIGSKKHGRLGTAGTSPASPTFSDAIKPTSPLPPVLSIASHYPHTQAQNPPPHAVSPSLPVPPLLSTLSSTISPTPSSAPGGFPRRNG